jgi:hypothetical protein
MDQLTSVLEEYLVKKVPNLPVNIKELIVKYAPILNIIGLVLSVPAILALLGLGAMFSAYPYGAYGMGAFGFKSILGVAFLVVSLVLRFLAIPGLKAQTHKGWQFIYYATLVNAVYSLVSFDWGSLIIGTLISLYFVFQVKSYYKK